MDALDPENYQVCPYDDTHRIRNKRMQPHIHECRKNHPSRVMVKCPFNAAHMIPEAERRWHLSQCPDRHQIHSKIVEEMVSGPGNTGCVETPVYRPVMTHGETWEAADERREEAPEQFLQGQVNRPPAPRVVEEPEDWVQGLTARQKRQRYLEEKQAGNSQRRNPAASQRPIMVGGSRSLALLQQQKEAAVRVHQASDIYSEALQGPKGINMAIGRGMGATGIARGVPGQEAPIRPGGRGRAQQNLNNHHRPPMTHPAGRGGQPGWGGGLPMPPSSSPSLRGSTGDAVICYNLYKNNPVPAASSGAMGVEGANGALNMQGRGSLMVRTETEPSFSVPAGRGRGAMGVAGGGGVHYRPPGPGAWQQEGVPFIHGNVNNGNTASLSGRGRGFVSPVDPCLSGNGIPFNRMTSQPDDLAPSFSQMSLSGIMEKERDGIALFTSGDMGHGQEVWSSDNEDPDKYTDALSWTGGGYSLEETQPRQPCPSESNMSLDSNPATVGSWAAHMEAMESVPQPVQLQPVEPLPVEPSQPVTWHSSSNVSESTTDSDYQDGAESTKNEENASSLLRKLNKKLRQIREIEKKKWKGQILNEDQEEKLTKKEVYEKEAAELQKALKKNGSN